MARQAREEVTYLRARNFLPFVYPFLKDKDRAVREMAAEVLGPPAAPAPRLGEEPRAEMADAHGPSPHSHPLGGWPPAGTAGPQGELLLIEGLLKDSSPAIRAAAASACRPLALPPPPCPRPLAPAPLPPPPCTWTWSGRLRLAASGWPPPVGPHGLMTGVCVGLRLVVGAARHGLTAVGPRAIRTLLLALHDKDPAVKAAVTQTIRAIGAPAIASELVGRPVAQRNVVLVGAREIAESSFPYGAPLVELLQAVIERVEGAPASPPGPSTAAMPPPSPSAAAAAVASPAATRSSLFGEASPMGLGLGAGLAMGSRGAATGGASGGPASADRVLSRRAGLGPGTHAASTPPPPPSVAAAIMLQVGSRPLPAPCPPPARPLPAPARPCLELHLSQPASILDWHKARPQTLRSPESIRRAMRRVDL
ncbi:hypothetical protein PAPYR_2432 [Paratrimastix pyriformis]|uniref:Uncharacterized protein n=1 Tax=Paratrimastix pyriformis TaxID=342808 RepID=A0ABQ8UUF1_9EUKA|nr:hypothetical protein PAPYR_2432 [Paratrimastix pyriformis]